MGQSSETLIRASASSYAIGPMPTQNVPASRLIPPNLWQHSVPDEDHTAGAADPLSASLRAIPLVSVVIELLDRATEAVDNDRTTAKDCIARATALLQKDHGWASYEHRGTPTELARGGLAPWQMRQVTKHIDATLASNISTDECAAIARLSTSHFRRAFKFSFGMTFYRYVYQRRVERAQEMMVTTDQTLCQIARQCGFADKSHFARVFRRLVGPNPAAWRRL